MSWITPEQIAADLRVDVQTVRGWLRAGRIPEARKLPGGQWRLPEDAAERLTQPATSQPVSA